MFRGGYLLFEPGDDRKIWANVSGSFIIKLFKNRLSALIALIIHFSFVLDFRIGVLILEVFVWTRLMFFSKISNLKSFSSPGCSTFSGSELLTNFRTIRKKFSIKTFNFRSAIFPNPKFWPGKTWNILVASILNTFRNILQPRISSDKPEATVFTTIVNRSTESKLPNSAMLTLVSHV